MPVKVFLIEGREIERIGLKAILSTKKKIRLIGESFNKTDALEKLKSLKPDLILMNTIAPVKDVLAFTKTIKSKYPTIKILILTVHDYESALITLLDGGISGYVQNGVSQEDLVQAIEAIISDVPKADPVESPGPAHKVPARKMQLLTSRELDVLNLIAEGDTNLQMAQKLFTSVRTIESRRKKLLSKTGTTNTATLIRFACVNGIIT